MSGSSATSVGPGGADRRPHSRVSYGNCSNYSSFRVFGCFWMLLSVSLTVLLLQDLPTSVRVRFRAPLDVSELPKPHFSSPESFGSVAAAACFSNSVFSQCFKSFTSTPQMSMPQYNIFGRFTTAEISGASPRSQLLSFKVKPPQESNKCTVMWVLYVQFCMLNILYWSIVLSHNLSRLR